MRKYFLFSMLLFFLAACSKPLKPTGDYNQSLLPFAPDYSNPAHWAALPQKNDNADRTPESYLKDEQTNAKVDVFFLHPTTYTDAVHPNQWSGPIDDPELNKKTDDGTILFQASVFNGAGRIYAPRYRQAHLHSYFTSEKAAAKKAFQIAYQDVEAAFEYYLENYNNGRPIIMAAHSQGTNHAMALLKKYFEGKPLMDKLVAAYLVGMPVADDFFKEIPACETPEQTGCFCSWRSWRRDYYPPNHQKGNNIVVTNPLLWTTDESFADKSLNRGTILKKFSKGFKKQITEAQVHDGILWLRRPKFFGSFLIKWKNYHIADYNLYYANIRQNAIDRVNAYFR